MDRVSELRNNSETAFESIFVEYRFPLYSFLLRKIASDFVAREVVQLTFIKLWRYRHHLDPNMDIAIQLFRMAKTTLIDELRKIQVREKHYAAMPLPAVATDHVMDTVNCNDVKNRLAKLLELLPPKRREVFELSRLHCRSNSEIAEILSISPKTVENHLTLALRFIRPFFSCILIIFANLVML
ncbi:sigma-70 family RNA polymerase sigma factor [Chitinophaga sedimenti]|uniref:sigma-70 family RNA polymerase sigma factor n=1 Tax=Chitinophaga sedimenti TaxID=2033606 RepID=UPI002002E299|nr:sigma-70 family RNA polymerase sigma factor [Chitinophaga sedimenti]MCK7557511.1 sigma-70 family RNA polymerase sigma factor [Chitinophaga sedimenti]